MNNLMDWFVWPGLASIPVFFGVLFVLGPRLRRWWQLRRTLDTVLPPTLNVSPPSIGFPQTRFIDPSGITRTTVIGSFPEDSPSPACTPIPTTFRRVSLAHQHL